MNIRKLFRNKFSRKADVPKPLPATVGNGAGAVEVPGRRNYVYVRIGNSLAEAYCDVSLRHGAQVLVGYDQANPRLFRVLPSGGQGGAQVEVTSERFRWAAPGGGEDPLFVELRQLLPARVSPAGGLSVQVYPGIAWCGTGWKAVGGGTIDLSSYVPTTSGTARMVLISVDDSGNTVVTPGSVVNIADLGLDDLPAPPGGAVFALAGVRLYAGQTQIREGRTNTDIADLRFPVAKVIGGGDMLKSVYDTDNDGVVDAAESVDWDGVQNKPSSYPPESHQHAASDVASGTFDPARIPNLDASKITSGTLSTDRFSAYSDLQAESKIGLITGRIPDANQVRFYSPASEAHDFISTTLPSGWSWAGSPFVTPTLATVGGTFLQVQPGTGNRSFMFRTTFGEPRIFGIQSIADSGSYIAWRLDDGSDDNYIEIGLRDTFISDKQLFRRYRTGGGSITEIVETKIFQSALLWMGFYITGTQWTSWTLNAELYNLFTMIGYSGQGTFSFTPTRFGIVFYTVQWWYRCMIDGVN